MSHDERSLHSGFGLSNPTSSQARPPAARPPGPPPRPPAPPRRPVAAPPRAEAAPPSVPESFGNPFLAAPAPVQAAPVLAAPSEPVPVSVSAAPLPSEPVSVSAPLVSESGAAVGPQLPLAAPVLSPNIRDPHAAFRQGNWKKPALFVGLAAAVLVGLFFGLPSEDPELELAASPRAAAPVIGASLPPERIVDTGQELTEHKQRFEQKAQPSTAAPAERPSGIVAEKDFAQAFKAAAGE